MRSSIQIMLIAPLDIPASTHHSIACFSQDWFLSFLLCASGWRKDASMNKWTKQFVNLPMHLFFTSLTNLPCFLLASDPANCLSFLPFLILNLIWRFESSGDVFLHFLTTFLPKHCAIPLFTDHFEISLDYSTFCTILDNHQKYIIIHLLPRQLLSLSRPRGF